MFNLASLEGEKTRRKGKKKKRDEGVYKGATPGRLSADPVVVIGNCCSRWFMGARLALDSFLFVCVVIIQSAEKEVMTP